jgi:hypothetical protein
MNAKTAVHFLADLEVDLDVIEAIATAARHWIEAQPGEEQDVTSLALFRALCEKAQDRTAVVWLRKALADG